MGAVGERSQKMACYLAGLDRGEIMAGRVLQILDPDGVRVAAGPGVFWARVQGGRPVHGAQRFEVVVPGERPVLRLVDCVEGGQVDLVLDPSADKAHAAAGKSVDRRA